jgi:hypothetical protein
MTPPDADIPEILIEKIVKNQLENKKQRRIFMIPPKNRT